MAGAIKGDEYLTVAEAAEMLDCTTTAIHNAIQRNKLVLHSCGEHQLSELKQVGVLPMKTTQSCSEQLFSAPLNDTNLLGALAPNTN